MTSPPPTSPPLWACRLILLVAVGVAMCRLFTAEFTWWDDHMTVHQNPLVNNPTLGSIAFFWKEPTQGLYVPITFTTWALIAEFAKLSTPVGDDPIFLNSWHFHTVNVLIHLASTLLVFALLVRLLRRHDLALIGALFFGLHPLQVESVGWISGMKDLLCWMFSLGVVLLYVRRVQAAEETGAKLWASWELPLACLLLVMGILSKPTAIVTPAALLAIDGLLLRRQWVRPLLALLPLFAITAAGAVVARIAQYVDTVEPSPLWQRPFIVADTTLFYFAKILWPSNLCVDYSRTFVKVMANPHVYWLWIIPAAVFGVAAWRYRRWPLLAAGLAIFFIGYSPVSGIATFQMQEISIPTDHYLYFSLLGIALIFAWLISLMPARAAYIIAGCVLVALGSRTYVQTGIWRTSERLFASTIAANPQSAVARHNLAVKYMSSSPPRLDLAEQLLTEAISLRPHFSQAYSNLGRTKAALGKFAEARLLMLRAWEIMDRRNAGGKDRAELARSLAMIHDDLHDNAEAIRWAEAADRIMPFRPETRRLLAHLKQKAATQPAATTTPTLPDASAEPR